MQLVVLLLLLFFFLPPSVLQSFECNDRVLAFTLEEAAMFVVPTGRFTDPLLINYWIYPADQTDSGNNDQDNCYISKVKN